MFALTRHAVKPFTHRPSWLLAALTLFSSHSYGVMTDNLTIGNAKAISMGNAVTADPPGIDSVHYNPAGLAALKGTQTQVKLITANFSIKLKFGEYDQWRKDFYADMKAQPERYPERLYTGDEAHNSVSTTSGATIMVPGLGMTDLPVVIFPIGGISYSPEGSNATFATNVYTPLAAGFYRDDNDPGKWIGQRISFMMLTYFSPSFAYKFNDKWSVGATLTFNYAAVGLDLPFREPNTAFRLLTDANNSFCGGTEPLDKKPSLCSSPTLSLYDKLGQLEFQVENPLTIGFNFGALYSPQPWLTFGFVYQAPVPMKMKGDFSWTNSEAWNSFVTPLTKDGGYANLNDALGIFGFSLPKGNPKDKGTAKLNMTMPEHFSIGTSVHITPPLKLNIDYKFTAWSAWKGIPVEFSTPIDFLRLAEIIQPNMSNRQSLTFPLGLEDTWNLGVGLEYQWTDRLAIRCGVEDRPSSIPKESRSPLLPMGDGKLYGFGIGYEMKNAAVLDVGFAYFSSKVVMPGGTSRLGNSDNGALVIYNPYAGTDIEADLSTWMLELSYRSQF